MKSGNVLILLAASLVTAVYTAGSWSNRFVYDDHEVIENQFPIHHLNDLGRIFAEPHYLNFPYYRPITRTTFALQMTMSGQNPWAYHIVNALLAGVLVIAANALLRRPAFGLGASTALVAATWFGLHPAVSECVYPAASGRETLLPAIFILLTMWAYLGRGWQWFATAMALFACSLLSKEQAAVLPGLFLAADVLKLGDGPRGLRNSVVKYAIVGALLTVYFVIRHRVFGHPTIHFTLAENPLGPFQSMLYGIQTAITPFMALRYEPPFETWFDAPLSAISGAIVAFLIFAVVIHRNKVGRPALFWLLWFVLLQLPTAHIVQQEAGFSERYAALAILAIPAVVVMLIEVASRSRWRTAAAMAVAIWIIIGASLSYLRGAYYTDDASFCLQWQNTSPNAAGPHDGFGRLAAERGENATAIDQYRQALELKPDDATAHENIANLLAAIGDFAGATQHYEWLMNHNASGDDQVATMTNYAQMLGQIAFDRGDAAMRDRAHGLLNAAIQLKPDYAQAHYILGEWNIAFGTPDAAIRQLKIALQLRPDWPEVKKKLDDLQESQPPNAASVPSTQK